MMNHLGPYTPAGRLGRVAAINEFDLPIMAPLFDTNGDGGGGGGGGGGDDDVATLKERLAHRENEFKTLVKDRDGLKTKLRDLEGKVLSDDDRTLFDTLKTEREKAEEDRQKKAGEWDALKKQNEERFQKQAEKHAGELKERDDKFSTLSQRHRDTVITAVLGAQTDLFGGHSESKTILDVTLAKAALGQYIDVDDHDQVVVKNLRGEPILGRDGNPAPFGVAILELIDSLPNKDRILRGSGKAGSGNGGGGKATPVDFATLARKAAAGDQEAAKQLKAQRPSTGIVMGEAYS